MFSPSFSVSIHVKYSTTCTIYTSVSPSACFMTSLTSLGSSALLIRLIRRFQLYVLGDCYLLALAALGEGSAEKNDSFIQLQAGYSALTRPFALLKRHKEEQQNKTKNKNISRAAGLWSSDLETKMFFFFTFTHLRASSTTLFFADHLGKDPP